MPPRLLPLLFLTLACDGGDTDGKPGDTDTGEQGFVDKDGDGFGADEDCDDNDAGVNGGAQEICDNIDNDCDEEVDEGVLLTFYEDTDGDGYGDPDAPVEACNRVDGLVPVANDCDDTQATVYPGAPEQCDELDNDCDDIVDEDVTSTWYTDADGDGYGDPSSPIASCDPDEGAVDNGDDCDDDEPQASPAGTEVCDGIDNDCDGDIDDDLSEDRLPWYADRDGDGFGDADRVELACEAPEGFVADDTDCDDLVETTFPGADERCDGADNDCDGETDEDSAIDTVPWYADADADGFGDAETTVIACDPPEGYLADTTDCDDTDASENPDALEVCDGDDDDCDGEADEDSAADAATWYADADADGFGDAASTTRACEQPDGYLVDDSDCDDSDASENPNADEVCDGDDDDCDDEVDEDSAVDALTWYADRDGDSYGDPDRNTAACEQPDGYVADATDCDDLADSTWPGADEVCDDSDNDCDDLVDDADSDVVDPSTWYRDADSDLYGDPSLSQEACDKPSGYVADATDCDDADRLNNPGGTEICDDEDNDCDGSVDESGASGETSWYPDADGDTYGDESGAAVTACDVPTGYVASATDCDDTDSDVNPGETEYCDGTDNDCDGDEDGAVTYKNLSGTTTTDLSSTWAAGTVDEPRSITLSSSGTVSICPGTYYVNITASATALAMTGTYGSDQTTLSGDGSGRVIVATGDLTLTGLTLQEGQSTANGGCLYVNGSDATLSDVVVQSCDAVRGGNIAVNNGTLTLSEVELTAGDATYGGGLWAGSGSTVDGSTVLIYENEASYGGGVYITGSELTLDDTEISDNDADTNGGGLYLNSSSTAAFTDSNLSTNLASSTGGGAYVSASSLSISSGSNISRNEASYDGGGIYMSGASSFSCTGSTSATAGVWGNTSLVSGGIYMPTTSGASITSTTCDWTGTVDNSLYDIVIGYVLYYSRGNNATFTCSPTGC